MATTSISKSLLTSVLSVYFVLTLLVTCVQILGEYYDTKGMLVEELQNQQSTFSQSLARSLWEFNYEQINAKAEGLISIPAISGIIIRDDTGKIMAQLGDAASLLMLPENATENYNIDESNGVFGYYAPLIFEFSGQSTPVGDVTLFSTRDVAIDRIKVSLYFIIGNAIIKSTFLIVLFSLAFSRQLHRPMRDLTEQIQNFRLDDLEHSRIRLHDQRNAEFLMVEQAYNQLLDKLEDYQQDLQLTQQQLLHANRQLDEHNAMLEQDVAHKTSSLSQVLLDLERRKNELEQRQEKLMREIRQRQIIEADLREANGRLQSSLTALERAQSQLLESEKMASLGGLVAGITHDVSTPLGISITAASFLRDQMQTMNAALTERTLTQHQLQEFLAAGSDAMQLLENNLARASDLIGSFKQVAVDQTSESIREFNLKKYLQDVIQSLRPRWKNTQHQIELDCADNISIVAPAGAFAQIFTNLMVNSLLHGFESQAKGQIRIVVKALDDNQLEFTYSDNGKGLTAEQMEKLFDPFFTTKRQQGGSGLGAHIIRNLVIQTLHGSITANSEVGNGLTYRFVIPVSYR